MSGSNLAMGVTSDVHRRRTIEGGNNFIGQKANQLVNMDWNQIQSIYENEENMIIDSFKSGFPNLIEERCGMISIIPSEYAY